MSFTFSQSEENYLKTIYHLQVVNEAVTTNEVAEKLQTRPASVTDMMKKLNAKKLLHYKPYYGFYLSNEGKKIALNVIRRHRLWEYFLAEKLKFSWDEVHAVAEELEHVSSKKLIDKLDEYLEFPQFDPHGDPIPDKTGKLKMNVSIPLSTCPKGKTYQVIRLAETDDAFLAYLDKLNIRPGTKLKIIEQHSYDLSCTIAVLKKNVQLSEKVARNILVQNV